MVIVRAKRSLHSNLFNHVFVSTLQYGKTRTRKRLHEQRRLHRNENE